MALKMNFPQNKEERLRPTWRIVMKTKLTFLLALTFQFLLSGSVFGEEEVKKELYIIEPILNVTHLFN